MEWNTTICEMLLEQERIKKFLNDPDIPERNKDSVRGWFKEKYLDPSVQRVKENSERWKQNQTVEREYSEYKEPIY
jgi:hypothetical protein